jgi:hypothetical protein
MMRRSSWVLGVVLLMVMPALAQEKADAKIHCKITFDMAGWAFIYRKADGSGTISCSNGDSFDVVLEQRGLGLAAGKGEIKGARGVFSPVEKTEEVLGTYIGETASAGAGDGDAAGAFVKGSLALAVSGQGDLKGLSAGGARLTIKRNEPTQPAASQ